MDKKGNTVAIYGAIGGVLLLVMLGIILSSSGNVVSSIQGTQTAASAAYNISGYTLTGMLAYGQQQSTIWLVAAVSLIIAVLMGAFAYIRLR